MNEYCTLTINVRSVKTLTINYIYVQETLINNVLNTETLLMKKQLINLPYTVQDRMQNAKTAPKTHQMMNS